MLNKDFILADFNLRYVIDVDYHRSYPAGRCTCENDYCRCMVIDEDDVRINTNSINAQTLLDLFIENKTQYKREKKINETLEGSDINLYAIGRIIAINKLYDRNSYNVNISGGYYGEELDSVKIYSSIANKVQEEIKFILQMDTIKEKIEYLLCLEYDHLLDDLYGKNWKVIEVDKSEINIPNIQHYKNVPMLDFYSDSNYNDIRCIIRETGVKVGKKYKLTDGYHRLKNTKKKTVKAILSY